MNPSTDWATRSGMGRPPIRTGATALGCTSSFISRVACLASSRVRNILMPPPVEPVLQTMQDRNSIQVGANTGHLPKDCEVSPEVVANETTLNSAWRIDVMPG